MERVFLLGNSMKLSLQRIKKSDIYLLLMWICAFMMIAPFGEFPINDDWAYSKNVFDLAIRNKFVVDQFPAMNLISQTIYGWVVVKCFGFSFFNLRISIFIMAVLASLTFKKFIHKLSDNNEWFSFFITCILFFNPIVLHLSFTFMTDIFFLSMMIFTLYQFYLYTETNRKIHYVLYILFGLVAILNRQHGLLLGLPAFILVLKSEKNLKKKIIDILMAAIPLILFYLAHDKYRHYLLVYHVPNGIQYFEQLEKYLNEAPISYHLAHAGDSMLVMGITVLPLTLLLLGTYRNFKWSDLLLLTGISLATIFMVLQVGNDYPLGNISNILENGPKVVKADSENPRPHLFNVVRYTQIVLGSISFILTIFFLLKHKSAIFSKNKFLFLVLSFIAAVYFMFVAISQAYFDRYNIPVILLIVILLVPQKLPEVKTLKTGFTLLVFCIFLLSVFEVKDFFNWQKTRWAALNHLNEQKISADKIDGGFEYNGWYKPTKDWSKEGKSWWWVADDEYVVTKQKLNNYDVDTVFIYQKYIPYTSDTIFILKRKNGL